MKTDLHIYDIDEVFVGLQGEQYVIQELSDSLCFTVPGAQFMPAYKKKYWDGKIRLVKRNKIYKGLVSTVREFCDKNSYSFSSDINESDFSLDEFESFKSSIVYSDAEGNEIQLRDYQEEAVKQCIINNRQVILSPTGSGKSIIIYSLIRFYLENTPGKILILVPNISLVNQLYSDFQEYSQLNKFNVEKNVCKIFHGQERQEKRVILSTWQSQLSSDKKDMAKYEVVLFDETHTAKSKEISGILEKTVNARYKFGFTGTIHSDTCNTKVINGLLGDINSVVKTSELIESKTLNDFKINCVTLNYPDNIKKATKKFTYEDEIKFLTSHKARTEFISRLATSLSGNTLILFSRVESHGMLIYDEIKKLSKDRKVYFVYGGTDGKIREDIRKEIENEENAILVASSQIFSTGINIKSLKNIIFAHPSKSRIRVLQSIGRVLRVLHSKGTSILYDIVDDLRIDNKVNYSYKHFMERVKLYLTEDFSYKMMSFSLK